MNKMYYMRKIGRGILLSIGLALGLHLVLGTSMSFTDIGGRAYFFMALTLLGCLIVWLAGLLILAHRCCKKSLLVFVILCILFVVGKWYWDRCPSDEPLRINGQCYSCQEPEDIYLRCELTPKQINTCPNRKVVNLRGNWYSIIPRSVCWEPEPEVVLDGGYWLDCDTPFDWGYAFLVLLYTSISLFLISCALYPGKKKNG